jgi:hypothetical protein
MGAGFVATLAAGVANAQFIGPTYDINGDEPGDGCTYAMLGEFILAGRTGGVNLSYADIDPSLYLELYWGPAAVDAGVAHAVQAALDGSCDAPEEDLVFSATASDLAAGVGRWVGGTTIWVYEGELVVPRDCDLRFTVTAPGALLDAEDVSPIDVEHGVGAVYPVPGAAFQINVLFEAKLQTSGSWMPLADFYDSQQTVGGSGVVMSLDFGFWYRTPLGDLNCDGSIDGFDIDPFVIALTDPVGYAVLYPGCDRMRADVNDDGTVDGFDIDAFVELLTAG